MKGRDSQGSPQILRKGLRDGGERRMENQSEIPCFQLSPPTSSTVTVQSAVHSPQSTGYNSTPQKGGAGQLFCVPAFPPSAKIIPELVFIFLGIGISTFLTF